MLRDIPIPQIRKLTQNLLVVTNILQDPILQRIISQDQSQPTDMLAEHGETLNPREGKAFFKGKAFTSHHGDMFVRR